MFDATDRILRQLRAGEDSRTEFKELRYGKHGVISPRTEKPRGRDGRVRQRGGRDVHLRR